MVTDKYERKLFSLDLLQQSLNNNVLTGQEKQPPGFYSLAPEL